MYLLRYIALSIVAMACACTGAKAQDMSVIGFTSEAVADTVCFGVDSSTRVMKIWLSNAVNPDFNGGGPRVIRSVAGFELKLNGSESVRIVSVEFPIPATNRGTGPNLLVEYAVPLTVYADQTLILATVLVALADTNTLSGSCSNSQDYFFVSPADSATVAGEIAIIDAYDPESPVVLARAGSKHAVFERIFVSTERETWGSIKALYR